MDRFTEMQIFIAVAECGGFAAGARRLKISAPVASRVVAELENRLGVKLLERTTRYVRTTEVGRRYLDDARRVLIEVNNAEQAAISSNAEPRGHLVVTAPVLFGRMHVMPFIIEYLQLYEDAEVTAIFADRVINLMEEGVDVALRVGELNDSTFRAIPIGQVRRVLCASPAYLATHGSPLQPDDLANHQTIIASNIGPRVEWYFRRGNRSFVSSVKPRLTVTSNDSAIEAAVSGLGIVRLLSYQVATEIKQGKLEVILKNFEPPALPIHILHREGRYTSAKIRSFIDLAVDRLRSLKE